MNLRGVFLLLFTCSGENSSTKKVETETKPWSFQNGKGHNSQKEWDMTHKDKTGTYCIRSQRSVKNIRNKQKGSDKKHTPWNVLPEVILHFLAYDENSSVHVSKSVY